MVRRTQIVVCILLNLNWGQNYALGPDIVPLRTKITAPGGLESSWEDQNLQPLGA